MLIIVVVAERDLLKTWFVFYAEFVISRKSLGNITYFNTRLLTFR